MFERNPIDNRSAMAVAVEIALADGSVVTGRAALSAGRGIHQLLSGDEPFLYVEQFDGEQAFIPRTEIKGVKLIQPASLRALSLPVADASSFDPHRVLGVPKTASWDEIRAAYHRLTKLYHPDRFAGVELPPEVASYVEGKTRQINAAFRLLKSPRRAAMAG